MTASVLLAMYVEVCVRCRGLEIKEIRRTRLFASFFLRQHGRMTTTLLWARLVLLCAVIACVLAASADYYSVLGVKRNVDDKALKKACESSTLLALTVLERLY